jgi:hypothetical protein
MIAISAENQSHVARNLSKNIHENLMEFFKKAISVGSYFQITGNPTFLVSKKTFMEI